MLKVLKLLLLSACILYGEEPISPLPLSEEVDKRKAALGAQLFFDPRLSVDDTVSCATCHIISEGGDDNRAYSFGVDGQEGEINSPTVLNAVYNFRQFWDGRAKTLQEQVEGPIENPKEMGFNFPDLIKKLQETQYRDTFESLYDEGISKYSITHAIAEYEKTLTTPNAPFDQYLRGDENAISDRQKEGYALFKSKGCISCHHGRNIGGNLYNKFGVVFSSDSLSQGRFNVTGKERDRFYFKVPSLRNIARTAPYFHDAREETLEGSLRYMAKVQLGRVITEDEIQKMKAFLESLSGELPEAFGR